MRGMWVVRDSIESPAAIDHVVATAKRYGFNALFVQVRGRGDSWYKSSYEPRAEELAGEPASFDPLANIIRQAHAQGIQVHAWLNTCYVWSEGRAPYSHAHIVNAHPGWLARDQSGAYHLATAGGAEGAFLSPSNAAVRNHLHNVFLEVARNYDVDGIHFDYIRYPNHSYDFSPSALQGFADTVRPILPANYAKQLDSEGAAAYQRAFPERWADWRREQVTSLVEWISGDIKRAKPWVCVSAAVYADWNDAFVERGQDWHRWLRDGALDAVVPMAYNASTMLVARQISDAEFVARSANRACYAGIGAWHIPVQSTAEKIRAARGEGAAGYVLFSYGGVTANGTRSTYLSQLDRMAMPEPISVPMLGSVAPRNEQETGSVASQKGANQQAVTQPRAAPVVAE